MSATRVTQPRTSSKKYFIEIYKKDEPLPLVTIMSISSTKAKQIADKFKSKQYLVKKLDSIAGVTDPENHGAIKRSGGFYCCVIEYSSSGKPIYGYVHYATDIYKNVEFLDKPHKSYADILDVLKKRNSV